MGRPSPQLHLFEGAPKRSTGPVGPVPPAPDLVAIGARLPPEVRLGTSSWSFPGWRGLVYDREVSAQTLARHGLRAYGAHPLLRTVGLDRTYYAPMTQEAFAQLAAQAPADFRFVVKALETATVAVFPKHPRYGSEAGRRNSRFLDPIAVRETLLAPAIAGLGEHLGPVVFQLPPQPPTELGGPLRFAMRLRAFLGGLPAGPMYAVEVRNAELVSADVGRALADAGAVPCLTVHPAMPPLEAQVAGLDVDPVGPLVVRWMLGHEQRYEDARARYAPFDRVVDPDPTTRATVAELVRRAVARRRAAYVVVNNKAEGSAPASIVLLARALAGAAS